VVLVVWSVRLRVDGGGVIEGVAMRVEVRLRAHVSRRCISRGRVGLALSVLAGTVGG
jgi:hypothetical protein